MRGTKSLCLLPTPRPAGRGKKDRPTPVHKRAEELGLSVRHPLISRMRRTNKRFLI